MSWLEIALLWNPRDPSKRPDVVAGGVVDLPISCVLQPGTRLEVQKVTNRPKDTSPNYRLVVVPPLPPAKSLDGDKGNGSGSSGGW